MTEITSETIDRAYTGSVTVGATAVPVSVTGELSRGVEIFAWSTNAGNVYVGDSRITAGTDDALDGFRLEPGHSLFYPAEQLDEVFLVGDSAGLKVSYLAY